MKSKTRNRPTKWRVLVVVLLIVGVCGGMIYTWLSVTGLYEYIFEYFRSYTVLETWPAYDEEYRLDTEGEAPTDEELAYYVATKIPDQHKDGLEGICILNQYKAVELAIGPDNEGDCFDPPYKGSFVVSEGIAFEISLRYRPDTVVCSGANLLRLLGAHSDCYFDRMRVWKGKSQFYEHSSGGMYVPVKSYERYCPDYVIQPVLEE